MKKIKIGLYSITVINILHQIVYLTFGRMTTSELGVFVNVFYIFRPEYMIVSGIVSFFIVGILLALMIAEKKRPRAVDIIMLIFNIEYLLYYLYLMSIQ